MEYKRLTDSETAVMLKNTEGSSWDSEDMEAQRYIRLAELEKENETKTDTITNLLKKQEFYEKEKLKQFAERLKEKIYENENSYIEFLSGENVIAVDIVDFENCLDKTLKEFIK